MIPASAASPVVVSTSHGTATMVITLPLSDTAFASTNRVSGVHTRRAKGVTVPTSRGLSDTAPRGVSGPSEIGDMRQRSGLDRRASNTSFAVIDIVSA